MFDTSIKSFGIFITVFSLLFFPARLFAEDVPEEIHNKELGTFKKWQAFQLSTGPCLIQSFPTKSQGKYKKRGEIYLHVVLEENSTTAGVISIRAGYDYKMDSEVTLSVGTKSFNFFTHTETADIAWSYEHDEDSIIEHMKKGTKMIVKGTSTRGTNTKDTYSLYGFTAAYKSVFKACKG